MKNANLLKNKALLLLCFSVSVTGFAQTVKDSTTLLFTMDTVAKNLSFPWEILHGPDDSLWITEARGYRVVRIGSGRTQAQKAVAPQQVLKLQLGVETNFTRSVNRWPQGGMQGLALHPDFMTDTGRRWVYLSYVYKQESCPSGSNTSFPNGFPCVFRSKIVRCRFYFAGDAGNPSVRTPKQDSLIILDTLLSNLPGSNDHNSGRLTISPIKEINPGVDTMYRVYYTIGDMGAGQFNNDTRTNYAQTKDTLEGKILRLNTEPDKDAEPATPRHYFEKYCRWIPNDNPFLHSVLTTVRTPVYSYGHRNAQGLVWGNVAGTWRLYSSEHGDKSDDEANDVVAGGNYGWPKVAGMPDNNYSNSDAYANNNVLAGQTVTWSESTWATAVTMRQPLFCFFNAPASAVPSSGSDIFTWPTIAPSSIDFYSGNIPGWKNSLLIPSLKHGLFRIKLNAAGTAVDSAVNTNVTDTFPLLHGWRVRDLAINPVPNSGQFWVVIDSTGSTSGPTGGFDNVSSATRDGGTVLRLTYKTPITLPVQFVRFGGRIKNDGAQLSWVVADADAQTRYTVEKSADGRTFFRLTTLPATQEAFTDNQLFFGNNYYRITATDKNGKISSTAIINLLYQPTALAVRLHPNPVSDVLSVELKATSATKVTLVVTDAAGSTIYQQATTLHSGTQTHRLGTGSWPAQVYLLMVKTSDGEVLVRQRFVKSSR